MSRIITFYSYKGGVGRTFALANIGVLLAKRGKRVLLMDWDLEAPGLHRYFKDFVPKAHSPQKSLIHLLSEAQTKPLVKWEKYIIEAIIKGCNPIHIIPSNDQALDYVEQVRQFSWNDFFQNRDGGNLLDRWRNEWKANYDFILVDSRTGITDTGGVCTVYLPDILVFVFSANEQSFGRGVEVINDIQVSRQNLSVPRPPLGVLPLPGRFDGRDEVDEAQLWLTRFANDLKPFYDDWLPKTFNARQMIELTKVPYITKFSFGEPLPVITQGITDPEFPGFYLENLTRLLASDFNEARQIISPESTKQTDSILELRTQLLSLPIDDNALNEVLKKVESEIGADAKLSKLLTEVGTSLFRQQRFELAESYLKRALDLNTEFLGASHPTTLENLNYLAELFTETNQLSEAKILYQQVIEQTTDLEGSNQLKVYLNLANVSRQMNRLDEALHWYYQALGITETEKTPSDPTVLSLYNNLASIFRELGRGKEAISYYLRALEIAEGINGPGLPATRLATYNNLASVYRELGRNEEAKDYYQRALYIAERTNDSREPAILTAYNNLASVYRELGRSEEAKDYYQRALDIASRTKGPGAPATLLATYNNLANVHRELGRSEEAISYYQRALDIAESTKGPGARATLLATYNNLANVYRELGRSEEAISYYQRALDIAESTKDPDAPATLLATYNNLAKVLRELGRRKRP